jgi:uncharacterized protein (DUF302 family)
MTFGVKNDIYFTITTPLKIFIMVYEKSNATGYSYIDTEIDKIKDKLSEKEQKQLEKLCEQIRSVGLSEGYNMSRVEGDTKMN